MCLFLVVSCHIFSFAVKISSIFRAWNDCCCYFMSGPASKYFGNSKGAPHMNRLKGKIAVVTGASKGIGAAIAKQFAAEGSAVVVNYGSSKTGSDAVVKSIVEKDGRAVAIQADLSKPDDVRKLFEETKKQFGK